MPSHNLPVQAMIKKPQLQTLRQTSVYAQISSQVKKRLPSLYLTPPDEIVPSLKAWSQQQPEHCEFQVRYEPEPIMLRPPNHIYSETHPAFQLQGDSYTSKEAFLCHLRDVRLVGPDGYLISSNDRLYLESLWTTQFHKEQAYALHRPFLRRLKQRPGAYVHLAMPWSSVYFHWLTDVLPRLALVEQGNFRDLPVIVSGPLSAFQLDSLAWLQMDRGRLVPLGDEHWQVDTLVFPSFPGVSGKPPRWVIDWLRDKFLVNPSQKKGLQIYVSRGFANRRWVTNETQIERYLKDRGFEIVHAEKLPFEEQVHLFADASVIVAPHGGGLTNVLFATNALVIELFAPEYVNRCYYRLCNHLGHEYWYVLGNSQATAPTTSWEGTLDMEVSLEALAETLDKAVGSYQAGRGGAWRS
jgi:capsular polysaccharide biosynthesis protein